MANKRPILTVYGDSLKHCRPGSTDWTSQGRAVTILGAAMAAFRNVSTGRCEAAVVYNESGEPELTFLRERDKRVIVEGRLSSIIVREKC